MSQLPVKRQLLKFSGQRALESANLLYENPSLCDQ